MFGPVYFYFPTLILFEPRLVCFTPFRNLPWMHRGCIVFPSLDTARILLVEVQELVVDACGGTSAVTMVSAKTLRVCDGDCVSACTIALQDQNLSMTSPNDCRVACSSLECSRRRHMKRGAVHPRGPLKCPLAVLHTVQALQRHISSCGFSRMDAEDMRGRRRGKGELVSVLGGYCMGILYCAWIYRLRQVSNKLVGVMLLCAQGRETKSPEIPTRFRLRWSKRSTLMVDLSIRESVGIS